MYRWQNGAFDCIHSNRFGSLSGLLRCPGENQYWVCKNSYLCGLWFFNQHMSAFFLFTHDFIWLTICFIPQPHSRTYGVCLCTGSENLLLPSHFTDHTDCQWLCLSEGSEGSILTQQALRLWCAKPCPVQAWHITFSSAITSVTWKLVFLHTCMCECGTL